MAHAICYLYASGVCTPLTEHSVCDAHKCALSIQNRARGEEGVYVCLCMLDSSHVGSMFCSAFILCVARHDDAYGLPHHQTLLDGELVVDEDMETGQSTRRFLAYDMMMLNGKPLVQKPFKVWSTLWERHRAASHVQSKPR